MFHIIKHVKLDGSFAAIWATFRQYYAWWQFTWDNFVKRATEYKPAIAEPDKGRVSRPTY
jgi:hypothetical protein